MDSNVQLRVQQRAVARLLGFSMMRKTLTVSSFDGFLVTVGSGSEPCFGLVDFGSVTILRVWFRQRTTVHLRSVLEDQC